MSQENLFGEVDTRDVNRPIRVYLEGKETEISELDAERLYKVSLVREDGEVVRDLGRHNRSSIGLLVLDSKIDYVCGKSRFVVAPHYENSKQGHFDFAEKGSGN